MASCPVQNNYQAVRTDQTYNTGDILVVLTQPIPIFNHFAIVFYREGKAYVAHNSFLSGEVIITPLDEFLKRKVLKVYPVPGLTDEHIYNKAIECNAHRKTYDFFGFNCEEFVREVCGCNFGTDQRKSFIIVSLAVIAIVAIAWWIFKRVG